VVAVAEQQRRRALALAEPVREYSPKVVAALIDGDVDGVVLRLRLVLRSGPRAVRLYSPARGDVPTETRRLPCRTPGAWKLDGGFTAAYLRHCALPEWRLSVAYMGSGPGALSGPGPIPAGAAHVGVGVLWSVSLQPREHRQQVRRCARGSMTCRKLPRSPRLTSHVVGRPGRLRAHVGRRIEPS
jgi:hypothetical protein